MKKSTFERFATCKVRVVDFSSWLILKPFPPGLRWWPAFPGPQRAAVPAQRHQDGGASSVSRREENGRRGVQPPLPAAAGVRDRRGVCPVHQAQWLQEHFPRCPHAGHPLRGHLCHVRGGRHHRLCWRGHHSQLVQHDPGSGPHHPLHLGLHPLLGGVPGTRRRHRPGGWCSVGPGN